MALSAARQNGLRGIVVPDTNASEAAVVEELGEYIPQLTTVEPAAAFPRSRLSALSHMTGKMPIPLIAVES